MKKHTLSGKKRTVTGKKVKTLRKAGELPATIYGKKIASKSVTIKKEEFDVLFKEVGETGLIEFSVDGVVHPVLVHSLQIDPVSGIPLHVEFHQVDLKEKVHAKVPLVHVGESPAAAQKLGVLLTVHDSIEVEALPAELPEKITIDVTSLTEVNQELKASQLVLPNGVTLLTDAQLTVVKVGPLVTKEAEALAQAEAAQSAAASAETTAPVEGAPAADGAPAPAKAPTPEK